MKSYLKSLVMAALVLALSQFAFAQKRELRIDDVSAGTGAVPGQMVVASVAGLSEQLGPPLPLERFEVVITQDGVARRARVRSTALGFMHPKSP